MQGCAFANNRGDTLRYQVQCLARRAASCRAIFRPGGLPVGAGMGNLTNGMSPEGSLSNRRLGAQRGHLERAEHYRFAADKLRRLAEKGDDPHTQEALLRIALKCDRLSVKHLAMVERSA